MKPYHHGALRQALIAAAEAALAEHGLEGFSLRDVARRAGVSHGAPAHHFGDVRGLLTAVAAHAFADLIARLEAVADTPDRPDRLKRMAVAYVDFAVHQPARFDLMWRSAILDPDDREYRDAADRAFAILNEGVTGSEVVVEIPSDPALASPVAVWCLMHGFARGMLDGAFGRDRAALDHAVKVLLPAVLAAAAGLFAEDIHPPTR
ncbi:MAG: TetR/AcrR family transcriptional regulator [Rhizomicrobium sp.]